MAYHFQEGEKRHTSTKVNSKIRSGFAITNDSLTGTDNENVVWDFLGEILEKNLIQVHKWNRGKVRIPWIFLRMMPSLNFRPNANPRVCLQNASYLPFVDRGARGLALLQDNLFDPKLVKMRGKVLRYAKTVVTNSIPMIDLDAENHFIWQSFPTRNDLIETESTFANPVGYFGNDLAAATASKKSDLQERETLPKMSLANLELEEEWEGLLLQELRKSFYPYLDESRTFYQRVVRRISSQRLVRDHA